jgi:hypothetical protein
MRTIEEEAKFIFGDLETGIGAERRRTWLWGATSKQVEAEKIKAQIEILKEIEIPMTGFVTHQILEKIKELRQKLKQLEDENT